MSSKLWGRVGFGLLALIYIGGVTILGSQGIQPQREFSAGSFALVLDTKTAGFLTSFEGGNARGEVVESKLGGVSIPNKRIGRVTFDEIELRLPVSTDKPILDWMADFLKAAAPRKNGAVANLDFNKNVVSTLDFFNTYISEVTFPALDGASKDAAYLTMKLAPESTRNSKGSGKALPNAPLSPQKRFLPSNFKVEIAGLDCSKVQKVDALTVKQGFTLYRSGDEKARTSSIPGKIEYPNLVLYVPEAYAKSFYDWHDDFLVKGNNGDVKEKDGSITLLSPNLADKLMTLRLHNLGILGISMTEDRFDRRRKVKVEMYCEAIELVR